MYLDGKLAGQGLAAAALPDGRPGCLLTLLDQMTKQTFLVDTGSAYSILPHSSSEKPSGPRLVVADSNPIKCWGSDERVLKFAGRKFKWRMLLAAVACPIITFGIFI